MANLTPQPLTQFITGTSVKSTDIYGAVDTTDMTQSPVGTTKQYTINQLQAFVQTAIPAIAKLSVTLTNVVVTPSIGSCSISFTVVNADGSNPSIYSAIPILVFDIPAALTSISAGENCLLYLLGPSSAYILNNTNNSGTMNVIITGDANDDWDLGVLLQSGNMFHIPFMIN